MDRTSIGVSAPPLEELRRSGASTLGASSVRIGDHLESGASIGTESCEKMVDTF
jgi:hypothetical protein